MFKNELCNGTHATRFIMSWVRAGGQLRKSGEGYDEFRKWITSLPLTEDERERILGLARNGKCELEVSAKNFLKKSAK